MLSSVGDRYYKVTAEALRVCGELVRVLRPDFEVSALTFRLFEFYTKIISAVLNDHLLVTDSFFGF
jgi:cullin-associated NEDD8-dissociated protein 1